MVPQDSTPFSQRPWAEDWVVTSRIPSLDFHTYGASTQIHMPPKFRILSPGTARFWSHAESVEILKKCFSVCLILGA